MDEYKYYYMKNIMQPNEKRWEGVFEEEEPTSTMRFLQNAAD